MGMYIQQWGKHFGPDPKNEGKRKAFFKGDIVELTPDQAEAFKDKFKAVEVVHAEAAVLKAQQDAIAKVNADKAKASAGGSPAAPASTPAPTTSTPAPAGSPATPPAGAGTK